MMLAFSRNMPDGTPHWHKDTRFEYHNPFTRPLIPTEQMDLLIRDKLQTDDPCAARHAALKVYANLVKIWGYDHNIAYGEPLPLLPGLPIQSIWRMRKQHCERKIGALVHGVIECCPLSRTLSQTLHPLDAVFHTLTGVVAHFKPACSLELDSMRVIDKLVHAHFNKNGLQHRHSVLALGIIKNEAWHPYNSQKVIMGAGICNFLYSGSQEDLESTFSSLDDLNLTFNEFIKVARQLKK